MKRLTRIFSLTLLTVMLIGCQERADYPIEGIGEGRILLNLSSAPAITINAPDTASTESTKAATIQNAETPTLNLPAPSMFDVLIIKLLDQYTTREYTAYQGKYQADAIIHSNKGAHTVNVSYGDATSYGIGESYAYYSAESRFDLPERTSSPYEVSLEARMTKVMMAVSYSAAIQEMADYYSVIKNAEGTEILRFAKDETLCGFTPEGTFSFEFHVKRDASEASYKKHVVTGLSYASNEFVRFSVDLQQGTLNVLVSEVSEPLQPTETIDGSIPPYAAPTTLPEVTLPASYSYAGKTAPSITDRAMAATIKAPGRIGSVIVKSPSGLFSDTDIAANPTALNSYGITYEAFSEYSATVDFTGFIRTCNADNADINTDFSIEVTDRKGKKNSNAASSFNIRAAVADASLNTPADYNIWARHVSNFSGSVTGSNKMYLQVKHDGESDWTTITGGLSGKAFYIPSTLSNLSDNKNYTVRLMHEYSDATVFATTTFKTEEAKQVGNAGMEEWNSTVVSSKIPLYFPYFQNETDKWWDSNNKQTAAKEYGTYNSYKCFPTTWYTTGRTGNYAARIMAVAVYSTNSEWQGWGETQGKLFIGTYGGSNGHSFPSRPSGFEFYYTYAPNGSDTWQADIQILSGTEVIGKATIISSETKSSWTKAYADITYSNTSKKATSIYIQFVQSTDTSPNTSKKTVTTPTKGDFKVYAGSVLTIDDINLYYD